MNILQNIIIVKSIREFFYYKLINLYDTDEEFKSDFNRKFYIAQDDVPKKLPTSKNIKQMLRKYIKNTYTDEYNKSVAAEEYITDFLASDGLLSMFLGSKSSIYISMSSYSQNYIKSANFSNYNLPTINIIFRPSGIGEYYMIAIPKDINTIDKSIIDSELYVHKDGITNFSINRIELNKVIKNLENIKRNGITLHGQTKVERLLSTNKKILNELKKRNIINNTNIFENELYTNVNTYKYKDIFVPNNNPNYNFNIFSNDNPNFERSYILPSKIIANSEEGTTTYINTLYNHAYNNPKYYGKLMKGSEYLNIINSLKDFFIRTPENNRQKYLTELKKNNINAYDKIISLLFSSSSSSLSSLSSSSSSSSLSSLNKDINRDLKTIYNSGMILSEKIKLYESLLQLNFINLTQSIKINEYISSLKKDLYKQESKVKKCLKCTLENPISAKMCELCYSINFDNKNKSICNIIRNRK